MNLTVRLPKALYEWVKEEARAQTRSLNGQIIALLAEAQRASQQDSNH